MWVFSNVWFGDSIQTPIPNADDTQLYMLLRPDNMSTLDLLYM